ncbi:DUF4288 domain-containing protein [Comamonas sp. J-3]|uniref:DUF4288 domain-containing protein n=1 Tax=Comamonas trifloxystrobinivorans TaxID=3350256 RepID=UPI00372A0708
MTWYTASLISAVKLKIGKQDVVPVFEDFFLIEADSHIAAMEKAKKIGKEHASAEDDILYDGLPAERIFLGVRKIRSIYNPSPLDIDMDRPGDGTELTHSYYEVADMGVAKSLAAGNAVSIKYWDDATN